MIHAPLERYRNRATDYLCDMEQHNFSRLFEEGEYAIIPQPDDNVLPTNGKVLSPRTRVITSAHHIEHILSTPSDSHYYFSEFFTPGIEGVRYALGDNVTLGAFLWAQTFDKYDFTMSIDWMRSFEKLAFQVYDHVFVANQGLADLIQVSLIGERTRAEVHAVGLPFDHDWFARKYCDGHYIPLHQRKWDIIWSSRLDAEKKFNVFREYLLWYSENVSVPLKVIICSGTDLAMHARNIPKSSGSIKVEVASNLSKEQYVGHLLNSRIQFNCALQDWTSYTLLEAITCGCMPVYPAFRSFLEVFEPGHKNLYPVNPLTGYMSFDRLTGIIHRCLRECEQDPGLKEILARSLRSFSKISTILFE